MVERKQSGSEQRQRTKIMAFRVTETEAAIIKRAAEMREMSVADFAIGAALQRAKSGLFDDATL
jgi:uncharacterized protein (DUF1778 family)